MWTPLPCSLSGKIISSSLLSSPSFPVFWSQHMLPDHDLIVGCVWWQYFFLRVLPPELPVLVLNHPFSKPEHLSVLLWRINMEVKLQPQNYNVILLLNALYHQPTAWDCYKHIQRSHHFQLQLKEMSSLEPGWIMLVLNTVFQKSSPGRQSLDKACADDNFSKACVISLD